MTKAKLVLFTCQNTQTTQIPDLVDIFKIVCFSWKHNYSRLTAEKSWAIVLVRKVFGGNNTNMLPWLKQRKINCSDRPRSLTIGFTIVLLVQQLLSAKADITMILWPFIHGPVLLWFHLSYINLRLKKEKERCQLCPFPFVRRAQKFSKNLPGHFHFVAIATPGSYDISSQQGRLEKQETQYYS